jgi:uncharacterized protein (TIGR02231 family)
MIRKCLLTTLLVLFTQSARAETPVLPVTGKIDSVLVFSDRAVVRRVQALPADKGSGAVRFHSLPVALVRDSVRAAGKGVTITGVSVRPTEPASEREWLTDPLKLAVDQLEQKLNAERDRLANFTEQLRLLGNLAALTTAQSDHELRLGTIKTDGWKAAVEFMEDRRGGYQVKIRAANLLVQNLQRERDEAARKLSEAMTARRRSAFEVDVTYHGKPGVEGEVSLEYTVTNVSWTPLYDLRGSAEGGTYYLVSNANIRQTTGEAWEDVSMTLSTARPAVGTAPGMLQAWRVTAGSLTPPGGSARRAGGADSRAEDNAPAESAAGAALASTTLTVQLPGRETIASDSADHQVTLKTSKLAANLLHVAIPSLTAQVFLRARLNNGTGIPLLLGKVSVFLDGNFVGTSAFSHLAAAGEDFDIYLGPDQRLQVKRTLLKGDVEGSGVFAKKVTITNQWQIEIANYSGKSRQLLIQDQFPVSADPSIETKFMGASRMVDYKDANGLLTWRFDVAPSKREHFDFAYALTLPRAMWDRFEQQQVENERQRERERSQYNFDADPSAADLSKSPPSPSPAAAAPPKARQMYNLEQMIQRR